MFETLCWKLTNEVKSKTRITCRIGLGVKSEPFHVCLFLLGTSGLVNLSVLPSAPLCQLSKLKIKNSRKAREQHSEHVAITQVVCSKENFNKFIHCFFVFFFVVYCLHVHLLLKKKKIVDLYSVKFPTQKIKRAF